MIPHLVAEEWDHVIVPVSGGKDSQLVLDRALRTAGVREILTCVHQHTGFDHPLTYEHLDYTQKHYGVEIITTHHWKFTDVFDLIRKEHYFPSSVARNCTSRLKIIPFARWLYVQGYHEQKTLVLLGMRGGESANRSAQYKDHEVANLHSICDISKDYQKRLKTIQVNLPIVNLSTGQVFDELKKQGVKVNPLYSKGHKRVGCYPCLLAGDREWSLAAKDATGREHIKTLLAIEEEFKARPTAHKLIKIHPTRDVRALLDQPKYFDPFGFDDDDPAACAQCMT